MNYNQTPILLKYLDSLLFYSKIEIMTATLTKSDFDLTQILNGVTIMAPSPFGFHQQLSMNLSRILGTFIHKNKKGKLFASPLDVILEEGLNVVQPDLIYIKNENMSIFHPNGHIRGVPDLLIEIVSSGSVSRDTVEKYAIYEKYGVKEYWIVFPEHKVIEVFILKEGKFSLLCSTENTEGIISSIELQDLKLNIEEIFS